MMVVTIKEKKRELKKGSKVVLKRSFENRGKTMAN